MNECIGLHSKISGNTVTRCSHVDSLQHEQAASVFRQKEWNCVVRAQHKGRTGRLPPWQPPALHVAQGISEEMYPP